MAEVARLSARTAGGPAAWPCFVWVTNADRHGYIEFRFSIGDPALFLDMTLPPAAFAEFCARHRVRHLSADEAAAVDAGESRWRYGSEGQE